MKEIYEKRGVYGENSTLHHTKNNIILSKIKKVHPSNFLDAGCGDGFFLREVSKLGIKNLHGVDISSRATEIAKSKGFHIQKSDLNKNLPYLDSKFDMIYCGSVIEHIINPDHLLSEFLRILRPDGILLLTTPNLACWYNRLILLCGFQPVFTEVSTKDKNLGRKRISKYFEKSSIPMGHLRLFTRDSLVDILKLNGFRKVGVSGYPLDSGNKVFRYIDKSFSAFPSLSVGLLSISKK